MEAEGGVVRPRQLVQKTGRVLSFNGFASANVAFIAFEKRCIKFAPLLLLY
jgi:hypothetical protein